jgi:hypothetical protein
MDVTKMDNRSTACLRRGCGVASMTATDDTVQNLLSNQLWSARQNDRTIFDLRAEAAFERLVRKSKQVSTEF